MYYKAGGLPYEAICPPTNRSYPVKSRIVIAGITLALLGMVVATPTANAAKHKQSVEVRLTGSCADTEMIEDEVEDDCTLEITLTPKAPTRTVTLQEQNEDETWGTVKTAKTKSGKLSLEINATDGDDAWLDGEFTYRVSVKKIGKRAAYVSDEYTIAFTPADGTEEDAEEDVDSAEDQDEGTGNDKLDAVLDKLDDKKTSFDDNCTKSFSKDQCKLMFTPKGPQWDKLTPKLWGAMCEKLLKQSSTNCKLMYGASAPPPGGFDKAKTKGTDNGKLDTIVSKIADKKTQFDDNCSKFFSKDDCELMFTPKGPDWDKLTAVRWGEMCEKLLKQTAPSCRMMYGSKPPKDAGNNGTGSETLDKVLDNADNKSDPAKQCSALFPADDCANTFTPTGPNWSKLSLERWVPICTKLMKQSEGNCTAMYGSTVPPGQRNSGPPQGPPTQQ